MGRIYCWADLRDRQSGCVLYEGSLRQEFELRQQLRVFLHAVSHDLRNPVIGMTMTLKSFLDPAGKAAEIPQELLHQMIASGDRQIELINSLLETHATELNGITLHHQSIKIDQLVNEMINDLKPFFEQARTTLNNNIALDLPPIPVDPLHLRRGYENILSNALKYNRPGLQITLDAEIVDQSRPNRRHRGVLERFLRSSAAQPSPPRYLRCTISDNGIGMTQ